MSFGELLRDYREHRRWSLADLSRATHYSRGYLSNVENGRKRPTEDLARLCDEALRAKGELMTAARAEVVANLDKSPWQTAELIQRMRASDTTPTTLEALHATVVELCCQYAYRDALELRREAQDWLSHVGSLLRRPVGLKAHTDLLVAGGWLALLAGCVEYDLGLRSAAESTRTAALQLGVESGHPEIQGWAHEMTAWFALTQGRFDQAIAAARQGQAVAENTSVHVHLWLRRPRPGPGWVSRAWKRCCSPAGRRWTACRIPTGRTTISWSTRASGTTTRWTCTASPVTTSSPSTTRPR
jgi:transcriptional regulator with XRE-family HTH domain